MMKIAAAKKHINRCAKMAILKRRPLANRPAASGTNNYRLAFWLHASKFYF